MSPQVRTILDSIPWPRLRYGRPKSKTPETTLLKSDAKCFLEFKGSAAYLLGKPTSIKFETDGRIVMEWHKPIPQAGELVKYTIWTELIGFREFDFGDSSPLHLGGMITITYTIVCHPDS